MSDEVLTAADVAEILRVDRKTVETGAAEGLIPHRRLGRQLLFSATVIAELANELHSRLSLVGDVAGDAVRRIVEAAVDVRERIDRLCKPTNSTPNPFLDGYLYAIRPAGALGPIKIGKAVDPADRLATIQRINPWPLDLIGLAHGAGNEGEVHRMLEERRLHGEWFRLDENPLPIGATCRMCVR